jgi:exonuclease SbcD
MPIRILHIADLHMGWSPSYLKDLADERRGERDLILKSIVDYGTNKKNQIDMMIIAGDLFETHCPSQSLVAEVIRELKRIIDAGIILITVPGNHDEITYHDSVYRERRRDWPGILVNNPMPQHVVDFQLHGLNCHIYSMAYTGGLTKTSSPVPMVPRVSTDGVHIGIFHGSIPSRDWDYKDRSLPLSPESLRDSGYNYIAMGHIHKKNSFRLGDSQILYPGIIEGKGFSDPGEGTFTVVTIDEKEIQIQELPANVRPIRSTTIDITDFDSQEALENAIKAESDERAIQRIQLKGICSFPLHIQDLLESVRPYCYYLQISDNTSILSDGLLMRYTKEPTVRGVFTQKIFQAISECEDDMEKERLRKALLYGISAFKG